MNQSLLSETFSGSCRRSLEVFSRGFIRVPKASPTGNAGTGVYLQCPGQSVTYLSQADSPEVTPRYLVEACVPLLSGCHLSACETVCLSFCLSVCLSVCLPVRPPVSLSDGFREGAA